MILVLVLAGNKSDDYMKEQVTEEEGKALAKEINAIFLRTSAKTNSSIEEIFIKIGKKFINPNSETDTNLTKEEVKQKNLDLRREQIRNKSKRSFC